MGIGIATPGEVLHIVDSTSDITFGQVAVGFGGVAFDSTITLTNYALIGDGTDVFLNTPTGGTKFFRENNVDQAVLLHTSGNFGVGDSAPDSKIVSSYNAWIGPAAVSGDTVQNSSYMEEGIVINSGGAKELIALKDPAVAHGMTTNAETDTFGSLLVSTGFLGGLSMIGYSEDQLANTIIGRAASGSTFKGTSSLAPVTLNAQKKSGTTVTAMAANENLVTISNGLVSPQTKWILDADGDSWQQGSITLGTNVIHEGDSDTYRAFTDDAQQFVVGGETLLTLTEAAQDVVKIGDGGDVDINFNDDAFIQGSSGRLGLGSGITAPSALFELATGGVKNAGGGFADFASASTKEILFSSNSYFTSSWNVIAAGTGSWWIDLLNSTTAANDLFSVKYRVQAAAAGTFTNLMTIDKDTKTEFNFATEDLGLVDAGSAAATEQDWIEVEVGGATGYIRVFATK